MEEITLLASLIPCKSKFMIKRLNKIKEVFENDFNLKVNLIITENNNGRNLIFVNNDVIEVSDNMRVTELIERIVEKLGKHYALISFDRIAVGGHLS
ncbi:MAG: hypothetical protein QXY36_03135 [Sulfolobales archaeon]